MAGERASDPRASGFLSPLDRFEAVAPRKVRRLAGGLPGRAPFQRSAAEATSGRRKTGERCADGHIARRNLTYQRKEPQ